MAAPVTPVVLIISRDPEVKQVASELQADGLSVRSATSSRELARALSAAKPRYVAVLDAELAADPSFGAEFAEKLRAIPTLALLAPETDGLRELARSDVSSRLPMPIVAAAGHATRCGRQVRR